MEPSNTESTDSSSKNQDRQGKLSWQAREHETISYNQRSVLVTGIFLAIIILYAIITESPIMAITFILIGVVGYLAINSEAPLLQFTIDMEGVHMGREMYPYENIESFWILYEPGERKVISLHTNAELTPYVQIPLGDMDPLRVRSTLLQFIPEERHPTRLVDVLEKYF